MRRTARHLATVLLLTTAAGVCGTVPVAAADPITKLAQGGGAPYAVYLFKDLGGGAYYNATTGTLYAVDAGSSALITTAQTGADLLATSAAGGRDLLLLVNGAVLVPVTKLL